MKNHVILTCFTALILLISSCKHDPTPPIIDESTLPSNICFSDEIQPIIRSNCAYSGCHAGNQDPDLSTYDGIMHLVKAGNPQSSRLYTLAIGSQMPPSPKTPLNLQQVTLIYGWIKQGALNNTCGCDTNLFTFSGAVLPTILNFCSGCHSGSSPSGDINLETYSQIAGATNLYSRITNTSSPMPPSGLMDACKITQIKKWIDAGKPNN
ncbi:MAG: hypothetical protein WCH34_08520 [Bacteroidota bacterium]